MMEVLKLDFINGIGAHFGHGLELLRNASIDAALERHHHARQPSAK